MGLFVNDPAGVILHLGPEWAALVMVVFVSGMLIVMNLTDIALIRGLTKRPPGYLSWWMIPIFDWIGVTVFAYFMAKFDQATIGYEGTASSFWWSVIGLLFAVAASAFFIKTAHGADWTKTTGNTVRSLNIAGLYHLVVFFTVAYFAGTFTVRSIVFLVEGGRSPALWLAAVVLAASFFGAQLFDSLLVPRYGFPTPNELLSRLFAWWPSNF